MPKLVALRQIRESQLLTQEELAKLAGVTRATVSRIEHQTIEPRFSTIKQLARALKVQPADLISGNSDVLTGHRRDARHDASCASARRAPPSPMPGSA